MRMTYEQQAERIKQLDAELCNAERTLRLREEALTRLEREYKLMESGRRKTEAGMVQIARVAFAIGELLKATYGDH